MTSKYSAGNTFGHFCNKNTLIINHEDNKQLEAITKHHSLFTLPLSKCGTSVQVTGCITPRMWVVLHSFAVSWRIFQKHYYSIDKILKKHVATPEFATITQLL